jgi:hypothetical protein
MRTQLAQWIETYERAWRTPGVALLESLFVADARYSPAPYAETIVGLPAIARMWEAERLGAFESFTMAHAIVAVDGRVGVVRVTVHYESPREQEYRDLWIIDLDDDGRCRSFEEWPFWPPGTAGTVAGGSGTTED